MKGKKDSAEQIIRKLRAADTILASGKALDVAGRALEVSEHTFHRWRNPDVFRYAVAQEHSTPSGRRAASTIFLHPLSANIENGLGTDAQGFACGRRPKRLH